ncbi:MAG: DUF983 domain-containing protein [Acidimicrobiia bacterium]
MPETPTTPRTVKPLRPRTAVLRGLRRRCPLCGAKGIFSSFYKQRDRCPRCNYPTARGEDQWIGALGMNTMVSFTVLWLSIAIGFIVTYPNPPVRVLLTIVVSVAVVFPLVFYPFSKSLWSGIDLAMRPAEPSKDGVDPEWVPSRPTGRPGDRR